MGHVVDRWTVPGTNGRRTRGPRWGRGRRWLARWVDADGRERCKACTTRDEAEALLAKVTVDLAAGTYVSPTAGAETFSSYAERWRAQQLHQRPATREQCESRLRLHVYPTLGDRPMARVRRSDVQALVTTLAARLAPSTVEVTYGYVAAIFRTAVEDHVVAGTPCTRISLPTAARARVEPMTFDQVDTVRAGMPARWAAMVDLGAATGLRSGELRGLTVDRLTPALHVRGVIPAAGVAVRVDRQLTAVRPGGAPVWGPPKTRASDRVVQVGASTAAALVEHLAVHGVGRDGLVFCTPAGGGLRRTLAGETWRHAARGLELRPRSGWHDLRHFHASLLIRAGLSPRAVADRLGHEDPAETMRTYAHLWPDDEMRAVAATEAAFTGAGRDSDGTGGHRGWSQAPGS